ncbi:uroporphyrinogen-III synthase [Paenibacillus sp. DMB20]|uniref:uroporphyrinogen-III synthase n=1 Tax=Paenibacillus sp. DMB20 TaxID=1642570 RepID=UPI000627E246|nr:uroporphyrinogen-III synthase [Paenibacillus sp. DMB20]KKO54704.1 uroporphyrinogen-III synthase [Paenibacillus sp. DMB20]
MAQHMRGKVVALTGPRKSSDMAKLVEKMGGTPLLRPAQGTVFLDDETLRQSIAAWVEDPPAWSIFTTGIGFEAIMDMAEQMGLSERLLTILKETMVAARGYKTVNALKKHGLQPIVRDDDGSTAGLIRSFESHDLHGKRVALQLHGESAPKLAEWLVESGAEIVQILPYKHIPPEASELELLLNEIVEGKIDAVAFTSAPQFRFLADYARERGKLDPLIEAFSGRVVACAVGKVTAQGLREEGVDVKVVPEEERMGSMMVELGRYFARTGISS